MVCAYIERDKCSIEGETCQAAKGCAANAIKTLDGVIFIDRALCNGCGDCVAECKNGAIEIRQF